MTTAASPQDLQTRADPEALGRFLADLFDRLPEGAHAYTWRKRDGDKQTHWFDRERIADAAGRAAEATDAGADVYAGIGLSAKPRGAAARIKLADVCGIVGFVADVDFDKPGAAKQYAPDAAAALALIEAFPLAPTIIVHSGHGLQAWWLFPAPWMFADAGELATAAALSEAWGKHLQALAKDRGLDLDSVHDLPRIMRVPGSVNWKNPEAPVPARVLRNGGPRHEPEAFRLALPGDAQGTLPEAQDRPAAAAPTAGTRGTRQDAPPTDADFPADAHQVLLATHDGYRDTWQGERPDLRDQSPSGYCMALADLLVDTEWTDAQIVAALRRWRGERPERDANRKPQSWYVSTVAKARTKTRPPDAGGADRPAPPPAPAASPDAAAFPWDEHEALLRDRPEDYGGAWNRTRDDLPTQDDRDRCLALALRERGCADAQIVAVLKQARQRSGEHLERLTDADYYARTLAGDGEPAEPSGEELIAGVAKALGVPISRVEFVTGDEAFYILYTSTPAGKPVALQVSPEALASQSRFAAKLLAARQYPAKQKPGAWGNVVNAIRRAAEEIDAGEEATADGELDAWLCDFFSSNPPIELKPGDPIEHPRHPFLRDGSVWINSGNLKQYLDIHGARIKTTALAQRLRLRGGERKTLAVKHAGRKDTTGRFWRLAWPL